MTGLQHTAYKKYKQIKNSVALVHQRTIPTKRPLLVGEVSANFLSAQRIPTAYSRFSRPYNNKQYLRNNRDLDGLRAAVP
jgi:hypothetical protein